MQGLRCYRKQKLDDKYEKSILERGKKLRKPALLLRNEPVPPVIWGRVLQDGGAWGPAPAPFYSPASGLRRSSL